MTGLRRATVADAAELTRLRALMFAAMGRPVPAAWAAPTQAAFARRIAAATFAAYVVEDAGRVVGCGAGWVEEHLPSPTVLDGRRGHVASMSTEPAARRQGHARAVAGALLAWFDDLGVGRVDLRATPDGRPLYEALGFRVQSGDTMSRTRPHT